MISAHHKHSAHVSSLSLSFLYVLVCIVCIGDNIVAPFCLAMLSLCCLVIKVRFCHIHTNNAHFRFVFSFVCHRIFQKHVERQPIIWLKAHSIASFFLRLLYFAPQKDATARTIIRSEFVVHIQIFVFCLISNKNYLICCENKQKKSGDGHKIRWATNLSVTQNFLCDDA